MSQCDCKSQVEALQHMVEQIGKHLGVSFTPFVPTPPVVGPSTNFFANGGILDGPLPDPNEFRRLAMGIKGFRPSMSEFKKLVGSATDKVVASPPVIPADLMIETSEKELEDLGLEVSESYEGSDELSENPTSTS